MINIRLVGLVPVFPLTLLTDLPRSAYHMFYDHDSQSVFSFHDPSPQHEVATMQFLGAFQQGYIDLYNGKSSRSITSTRDHLHMGGSSFLPLRDGSTKEPDARVCIIRPGVGKPRLARCFVFECAYMNEDEATLVSETLRWADSGHFSIGLKIQDVVGWPTSRKLRSYFVRAYINICRHQPD